MTQAEQWCLPAPHADHLAAPMDCRHRTGWRPEGLADGERGNDVAVAAHSDQQTVDNGKGQWKQDGEGCALARYRLDLDLAAKVLDIAPYDIHANATTGKIGHLISRGESRLEDQRKNLGLGQARVGIHQAAVDGLWRECGRGQGLCHRLGCG